MTASLQDIQNKLFALQDTSYRDFQCKLTPSITPDKVIGVRMPQLHKVAREIKGSIEATEFLETLPHSYYDEDNLHGLLLCQYTDYDKTIAALERFLPYVDNWATCDLLRPKAFEKHPPQLPQQLHLWMKQQHVYTVRFAVGMLLTFYLDEAFESQYLVWASSIQRQEYYINMMVAWYFATALAKQYEAAIPYLQENRLSLWTHNKTIQKAIESRRISPEQKAYLKTLRRKA